MTIDFLDRLLEVVKPLASPFDVSVGPLLESNNIAIQSLPGGNSVNTYYDGSEDKQLPYEIAIKVKNDQRTALQKLNELAQSLEKITKLDSENDSYKFMSIRIASAPFLEGVDENEYYYYRFNFVANLTIK